MSARIPDVLYLSLRTGLLVERPSMGGWTNGDRLQWESEHALFFGQGRVNAERRCAAHDALVALAERLARGPKAGALDMFAGITRAAFETCARIAEEEARKALVKP